MRSYILIVFLLVCGITSFAQVDTSELKQVAQALDKALVKSDTATLLKLLDAHVTYGHSNGWVQTKCDVVKDLVSGYLVYDKIESSNFKFAGDADWASIRMYVAAKGKVNDKAFNLQLHVLEVWKKVRRHWMLIARQSAKI